MDSIKGEIYSITNRQTGKCYIGQTLTHRKNRGKYIEFGTLGRFKDHVSEAICNTKKKQCWYLNSAIRKYGKEEFDVECIEVCDRNVLDERERFYIQQYNSLYPNGYNLTKGGKTTQTIYVEPDEELNTPGTRGGCKFRSEETRNRISEKIHQTLEDDNVRNKMSERARQQHLKTKLERFANIQIDTTNIDSYIRQQKNRVVVVINETKITFASKQSTPEERYTHARSFLLQIANSATLPN